MQSAEAAVWSEWKKITRFLESSSSRIQSIPVAPIPIHWNLFFSTDSLESYRAFLVLHGQCCGYLMVACETAAL
jgi:hypothetical protein